MKKTTKTFNDLVFKPHGVGIGKQCQLFFDNGYGISVVRFKLPPIPGMAGLSGRGNYGSYTTNEREWEVAVLKGNEKKWGLCYDTPITNDVIGYLTDIGVNEIMEQIQKLEQ